MRYQQIGQELVDYFLDMFSDNAPVTVAVRGCDHCGSDGSWVGGKHLLDDEIKKLSPIQASRFNKKMACCACQRASCIKRKWKEAMTPSSFDVHDDEGVPNKRLRAQQEAVSGQRKGESVPEDSSSFDVKEFLSSLFTKDDVPQTSEDFDVLSSLDGILEFDRTEDPGDEVVQNKQQRGDGVIELPWSNDVLQIVEFEGEMESLPEDCLTFDVEQCLSILDEILEHGCTEDPDDEGFQNKQQRAGKEALFVQQNRAIELSCSNDILKIVEFEGEMESTIELPWSNDILQIVEFEGEMESLPEDCLTLDVEEFLSILDDHSLEEWPFYL